MPVFNPATAGSVSGALLKAPTSAADNTASNTSTFALLTLSSVVSARTMSFSFDTATGSTSGIQGLRLERSGTGQALGLSLKQAGTFLWDTIAIDSATTDLVLAYDYTKSADILRLRQGGFALLSDSAGQPANTRRLEINSTASSDTGITDLLYLAAGATSTVTNFIKGANSGVEIFQLNKTGAMGLGRTFGGEIGTGFLEVKQWASIIGTDVDSGLRLRRYGTSTAAWELMLRNASSPVNMFAIRDVSSTNFPFQIEPSAPSSSILVRANGVVDHSPGSIVLKGVAGAVTDAAWSVAPPANTMAVDTTNFKIYVRFGSTWKATAALT